MTTRRQFIAASADGHRFTLVASVERTDFQDSARCMIVSVPTCINVETEGGDPVSRVDDGFMIYQRECGKAVLVQCDELERYANEVLGGAKVPR